jgi:hypothetical protein
MKYCVEVDRDNAGSVRNILLRVRNYKKDGGVNVFKSYNVET